MEFQAPSINLNSMLNFAYNRIQDSLPSFSQSNSIALVGAAGASSYQIDSTTLMYAAGAAALIGVGVLAKNAYQASPHKNREVIQKQPQPWFQIHVHLPPQSPFMRPSYSPWTYHSPLARDLMILTSMMNDMMGEGHPFSNNLIRF